MATLLNNLLNILNTYLQVLTYGNIPTHRRRLVWLMPFSIIIPIISLIIAWFLNLIVPGAIPEFIVTSGFIFAIIPWLLLLWLTIALYIPLILSTLPMELIKKLKNLNASPENAKKIAIKFFDIITWILVAGIYCYFFQVWKNIWALIPLSILTLFFIFSSLGEWIKPDPKFKKRIWKWVVILIFIPLTLRLISPNFYYHVFGNSLSEFSNKYPKSQVANEYLEKTIKKTRDKELTKGIQEINNKLKKGEITLEEAEKKQKEIKKKFKDESLLNKATKSIRKVKSEVKKLKDIWPIKKQVEKETPSSQTSPFNQSSQTPQVFQSPQIPLSKLVKTQQTVWVEPGKVTRTDLYLKPGDDIDYFRLSKHGKYEIINETLEDFVVTKKEFYTTAMSWSRIILKGVKEKIRVKILIHRN